MSAVVKTAWWSLTVVYNGEYHMRRAYTYGSTHGRSWSVEGVCFLCDLASEETLVQSSSLVVERRETTLQGWICGEERLPIG